MLFFASLIGTGNTWHVNYKWLAVLLSLNCKCNNKTVQFHKQPYTLYLITTTIVFGELKRLSNFACTIQQTTICNIFNNHHYCICGVEETRTLCLYNCAGNPCSRQINFSSSSSAPSFSSSSSSAHYNPMRHRP